MTEGAILVTGAAGALGSRLVMDLLRRGRRVIAVGRSEAELKRLLDAAPDETATQANALLTAAFELEDRSAWEKLHQEIERRGTAISGAVLAAGGWAGGKPFTETPDAVWSSMWAANLDSARFALTQVVPALERSGGGSVVLVGSRAAARPWESRGAAAYASAKAALVALTQTVAAEVLDAGVRVNIVLPSTIDTPANRSGMPEVDPSRWVSLDSLTGVICFLLSAEARDISGAALPVYGRA